MRSHSLRKLLGSIGLGLGLGLGLMAGSVAADDAWHFSGFGTVGALWLDEREFFFNHPAKPRGDADRPDLGADSLLGLQASLRIHDKTDVTVQVLSSDTYQRGYAPTISWAFIRHNPSPGLTLRAGRLRAPFFMFSDSLNVNYTHPWVRPPVEVYGLNPFSELDGFDLLYKRRLGPLDIEVQPYFGRGELRFPDGHVRLSDNHGFNLNVTRGNFGAQVGYGSGRLAIRYGDPLFRFISQDSELAAILSGSGGRASFASIGLRWDDGSLQVIGEFARRSVDRFVSASHGWHLTTAYRVGQVTSFVTFARQYQERPVLPRNAAVPLLNEYLASRNDAQRSMTIGARWDPYRNTAVKAQWTRTKIDRGSWGVFFPRDPATGSSPSGRTVDMLSLSLDFVF